MFIFFFLIKLIKIYIFFVFYIFNIITKSRFICLLLKYKKKTKKKVINEGIDL
jgi:hypothetical protein